ncbi:lipase family protein [Streptomyces sp. NPDC056485]|uniref:lipase family protein n=1 Tax=Streptomyces sp. NPDC056485 TaxID=3345834 RepID=UPI0036A5C2E1
MATRLPEAGLPADTPVGITGYSQGGQAGSWAADQSRLGRTAPAAPVYLYHALGDELIPYAVGRQLRAEWCARGASVEWRTIRVGEHVSGVITHSLAAGDRLADRFAGRPTHADC